MAKAIIMSDGTKCYTGPDCAWHFPSTDSLSKSLDKKLNAVDKGEKTNPLAKLTPVDVDEVLAKLYYQRFRLMAEVSNTDATIKYVNKQIARGVRAVNTSYTEHFKARVDTLLEKKTELTEEINGIFLEEDIYESEFSRRGGWTRAFLVANGNGHVHKTRSCTTCRPTTGFTWVTSYSGKNQDDVIQDAGESACTVCYPDAPVDTKNRPSKIFDPEVHEAQLAKAKIKEEKDRQVAIKAIANPDGTPLKELGRWGDTVRTLRSAEIFAVDKQVVLLAIADDRWPGREELKKEYQTNYDNFLKAIAHKKGTTIEEQHKILKAKALKKYNKEWN